MRWKSNIWARRKPSVHRRRLRGHLALAAGLTLVLALGAGCRSTRPGNAASRISLRIGTVENAPPLIFRQKGRWVGLEADLARALADRLGMEPLFIAYPASQLASALLEGNVDVLMAGLSITEERRVQMDFSSPYLVVGQAALIRTSDLRRYNTDIRIRSANARIGVVAGGKGDELVSRYFTNARRIAVPDAETGAQALLRNEIDMLIHDATAEWWISLSYEGQLAIAPALFAREEIAWGVRRGSVALREAANQALADWQKTGELESILKRWIPVSK